MDNEISEDVVPETDDEAISLLRGMVDFRRHATVEHLYRLRRGWGESISEAYNLLIVDLWDYDLLDKE